MFPSIPFPRSSLVQALFLQLTPSLALVVAAFALAFAMAAVPQGAPAAFAPAADSFEMLSEGFPEKFQATCTLQKDGTHRFQVEMNGMVHECIMIGQKLVKIQGGWDRESSLRKKMIEFPVEKYESIFVAMPSYEYSEGYCPEVFSQIYTQRMKLGWVDAEKLCWVANMSKEDFEFHSNSKGYVPQDYPAKASEGVPCECI